MSKIKLIVEIEKRTYELIKDKPDNIAESIIANGIPYNPTGDAISREALKNNEPHYDEEGYRVFYESEIDNAQAAEPEYVYLAKVTFDENKLKELTDDIVERIKNGEIVVKDERPTDEWKEWTDERWGGTTIYCPYCKEDALEKYSDGLHRQVKSNFCPNCGIKLEKGGKKNEH